MRACAACQTPGDLRCAKCRDVYYCSVACQREHWRLHKLLCSVSTAPAQGDEVEQTLNDSGECTHGASEQHTSFVQAFIQELNSIDLPLSADSELHKVLEVLLKLAGEQDGRWSSEHLPSVKLPRALIGAAVQAWLSSRFVVASACLVAARWVRCYQQDAQAGGGQALLHATRALCDGMRHESTPDSGGKKILSMGRDVAHAIGPLALSIPDYSSRRLGTREGLRSELQRLKPCACLS